MKCFVYVLLVTFVTFIVGGCSNPLQTHVTTIKTAIKLLEDVSVTKKEVLDSPIPLALIKSGERPTALIAQAYNELGKEKWVSNDRAMLVIRNGRVIKTLGFDNDLLAIIGPEDPLQGINTTNDVTWIAQLDWEVGEYGYLFQSEFKTSIDKVVIFDQQFDAFKVTESVVYNITTAGSGKVSQWQNNYWFDKKSGSLLKSSQQSGPFSDRFEITYVSNAVALM